MWIIFCHLPFTTFFRVDPALNTGAFLPFIFIASPVWGFRAILSFRSATRKTPNPTNWTFPPEDNSVCITFINPFKAFSLCLVVSPLLPTCCRLIVSYSFYNMLLSHKPHNFFRKIQSISFSRYRSIFSFFPYENTFFSYTSGTSHVPKKKTFARLLRRSNRSINVRY